MRAFVFGILIAIAGCAPAGNEPVAAPPSTAATPEREATREPAPTAAPAPAATHEPMATRELEGASAPVASPQPAAPPAPAAPEAARRAPKELLTKDGVNYECSVPADCAVKDVGNCCGYYPACVNKDSPTFPDQVKAQCGKDGMSSICGFPDIGGCDCIEGRCTAMPGTGGAPGDVQKD